MRKSSHEVAVHEAAHAVIGRVLGLTCGHATIVPNEAEGEAGHAILGDPWHVLDNWEQRAKFREPSSVYRGRILATMAGAEAQTELRGGCGGGDGHDRREIELMAASDYADLPDAVWQRYEPRMRRQTRRLIRKHRDKIERVAAALLERDTLTANEIDAIVDRATDAKA